MRVWFRSRTNCEYLKLVKISSLTLSLNKKKLHASIISKRLVRCRERILMAADSSNCACSWGHRYECTCGVLDVVVGCVDNYPNKAQRPYRRKQTIMAIVRANIILFLQSSEWLVTPLLVHVSSARRCSRNMIQDQNDWRQKQTKPKS